MPTVRTIFQPDKDQEMDEDEAAMLRAGGLLVEDSAPAAPAPAPAPTTSAPAAGTASTKQGASDGQ